MPDWPDEDLGLDAPRALGPELRHRLEQALHDPVAAVLAGVDRPRALSPALRGRLEEAILARPRRRPTVLVGGAVAAALAVLAATGLVLSGAGRGHGAPAQAGRVPTSVATPAHTPAGASASGPATGLLPAPAPSEGGGLSATAAPDALAAPTAGALPVVSGLTPSSGPASGGTWVTVEGAGLGATRAVDLGGVPASFVVVSSTELRVRTPAHAPGTVDLRVRTPAGTSAPVPADRYRYR